MSADELRQLAADHVTIDMETATRAIGMGINQGYELHRRGEFPVRVLKLGRRLRVPTADLVSLLLESA